MLTLITEVCHSSFISPTSLPEPVTAGGAVALKLAIGLLLPVACIWFPEALGDYAGTIRGQLMTASTPAFLVCAGGWLVLVGVPLIAYALSRGT
jgi:hypothetical protein